MRAIIIDDELRARQSLQLLLKEYCNQVEVVAMCENIPEGVKAIHKHKPELVLLDIEMPGHSGLELLDFFDDKDIHFSIIFTTAYNEYAIQAFKLSAIDYLLKPIIPDDLVKAIKRFEKQKLNQFKILHENIHHEKFEKIAVPVGSNYHVLNLSEVVYIKGEGAYSEVHLKNKSKLLVSRNLKNFEDILQADHKFIRSHKSYIVNFDEVVSYSKSDGGWIDLSTGNSLPVSNEKTNEIIERLNIVRR